ncbi:MAG: hypothetical protein PVI43_00385 [Candidatus Bathyarchaeota archaeon]|jgi:hypothetical protein
MAARARKHNESFKKYRANLLREAFAEKVMLRGKTLYSPMGHIVTQTIHGEKKAVAQPGVRQKVGRNLSYIVPMNG